MLVDCKYHGIHHKSLIRKLSDGARRIRKYDGKHRIKTEPSIIQSTKITIESHVVLGWNVVELHIRLYKYVQLYVDDDAVSLVHINMPIITLGLYIWVPSFVCQKKI